MYFICKSHQANNWSTKKIPSCVNLALIWSFPDSIIHDKWMTRNSGNSHILNSLAIRFNSLKLPKIQLFTFRSFCKLNLAYLNQVLLPYVLKHSFFSKQAGFPCFFKENKFIQISATFLLPYFTELKISKPPTWVIRLESGQCIWKNAKWTCF